MELRYFIPLLIALFLVIIDFILNTKKKRRIPNKGLISKFEKWGKNHLIKKLHDKPGSKGYIKLSKKLKQAGIKMSPEAFQTMTYIVPLIVIVLLLAIKYTNVINTIMNLEQLKAVAEKIGKEDIAKVNTKVNMPFLLIAALISHKAPEWILNVLISYRNAKGHKEVVMLQTYAIMMLKAGQSAKRILISLMDRSKLYKEPLEIAVNSFSTNPNKALKELEESVGNKDFKKLCVALQQTLNHDREISLTYLQNHRVLGRELHKLNRKSKNTKKSLFGMVLLIVPLLAFILVAGYPWLLFSLNQLDSVPM